MQSVQCVLGGATRTGTQYRPCRGVGEGDPVGNPRMSCRQCGSTRRRIRTYPLCHTQYRMARSHRGTNRLPVNSGSPPLAPSHTAASVRRPAPPPPTALAGAAGLSHVMELLCRAPQAAPPVRRHRQAHAPLRVARAAVPCAPARAAARIASPPLPTPTRARAFQTWDRTAPPQPILD